MTYQQITLSLLLLAFTHSAISSTAETRWYDVEIVIFENVNTSQGNETWPVDAAPESLAEAIDFDNIQSKEKAATMGFEALDSNDESPLKETVEKLSSSSRYRILSHMNWRQPGLATEHAIPIMIKGNIHDMDNLAADEVNGKTTTTAASLDENTLPNDFQQLEGTIRIDLARYLHLHADLIYQTPTQINQPVTTEDGRLSLETTTVLQKHHLKEHRRMRSKRLHYLDHPKIGLLAYIVQYIPPQEESLEATTEPTANTTKQPAL